MRKYLKFNLIGLALIMAGIVACDTADQDVSPVISPDSYPVATFTSNITGNSITEGDTVIYTITFDRAIDRSVTFAATQADGNLDEDDYTAVSAVMQPYTKEVELLIIVNKDYLVETTETAKIKIGVNGISEKYLVNPKVVYPTVDLSVANYFDPTLLTVNFTWNTADDIDIVTWSDTPDYPMEPWGNGGATGANPEIDKSIWLADPVGTYYVSIVHWGAPSFDYTFTLGLPDGTIQTINGSFDSNNLGNYTEDILAAWEVGTYRILKVVNDGTKFVVTAL